MGKYTIIADTGRRLVEMLQEALIPELLQNVSEIGLRSPDDKGDVSLGVFLYDIRPCEEVFQKSRVVTRERVSKPPIFLSLYYMITAYSKSDSAYKLMQEELILGRVIQYLYDHPVISLDAVDPYMTSGTELHIQMLNPDTDERSKLWSFPNMGNRLSLFYKVSPVAIDSMIGRDIARVKEVEVQVIPKSNKIETGEFTQKGI